MSTPSNPPSTRASTAPDTIERLSSSDPSTSTSTTLGSAAASSSEEFKVYKPPTTTSAGSATQELPDDYFTPTIADLKARQEQLRARTTALNNAPLLTRAQREEQAKAKRDRWPNTMIRVRFPDRTQLEKTFPSSDKIRSVYAFVRDSLREDVKPIKFILSSNPPPRDLKVSDPAVRDLTLTELELAPSSVLHLRFLDDALNRSDLPAPLAPAVLERAVNLPAPRGSDGNQNQGEASLPAGSATSSSSGARNTTGGDVKIPKWLKLGPKK